MQFGIFKPNGGKITGLDLLIIRKILILLHFNAAQILEVLWFSTAAFKGLA